MVYLIEIYRFIIALSLVFFHFMQTLGSDNNNLRLGVEFFFILSGSLLAKHCEKHKEETSYQTVFDRISRFYPSCFILYLLCCLIHKFVEHKSFLILFYTRISHLLFVKDFFEKSGSISGVGQTWFIGIQIWVTILLVYLMKHRTEKYEKLLAPFLAMGGYMIVVSFSGNFNHNLFIKVNDTKIFFPTTFFRGLASMSLGTLFYYFYRDITSKQKYTKFGNVLGTIMSIVCFVLGIALSYQSSKATFNAYNWRGIIVCLLYGFSILLAFTFSNNINISEWMKKISVALGKQAMNIYMVHILVLYVMEDYMNMEVYSRKMLLFCVVCSLISAFIFDFIVKVFNTYWGKFIKWLKNKCIA